MFRDSGEGSSFICGLLAPSALQKNGTWFLTWLFHACILTPPNPSWVTLCWLQKEIQVATGYSNSEE